MNFPTDICYNMVIGFIRLGEGKDGTAAAFSTLNDNFDVSFEGRNYTFRSSELARFLIGTVFVATDIPSFP